MTMVLELDASYVQRLPDEWYSSVHDRTNYAGVEGNECISGIVNNNENCESNSVYMKIRNHPSCDGICTCTVSSSSSCQMEKKVSCTQHHLNPTPPA